MTNEHKSWPDRPVSDASVKQFANQWQDGSSERAYIAAMAKDLLDAREEIRKLRASVKESGDHSCDA